jgi:WD40 repeat protein
LWDIASGNLIRTFEDEFLIYSVAILPDGRTALSAGSRGLKLWDIATRTMIRRILVAPDLSSSGNSRESMAVSPDGHIIVSGGPFSPSLTFSDIKTGELIRTFDDPDSVRSVAISSDGRMVLSGGDDGTARLWDSKSGTLIRIFKRHSARVRSVAFSPDGRTALSGSDDGTLKLWAIPGQS